MLGTCEQSEEHYLMFHLLARARAICNSVCDVP